MNIHTLKKLFFTFSLPLVFLSMVATKCKPEEEVQTAKIHPELKEFLDFKEGSWWVYRDSISGETDCTFVYQYGHAESEEQDLLDFNIEGLGYFLNLFDRSIYVSLLPVFSNPPDYSLASVTKTDSSLSETRYEFFAWSEEPGFPQTNTLLVTMDINILDSLVTLDTTYGEVYKSNLLESNLNMGVDPDQSFNDITYLVKNIGIVKYQLRDSSVYELIRYQVIQ